MTKNGTVQMTAGNGLTCILNMPRATESRFGDRGEELTSHLAPSAPVTVYSVDAFPNCPESWRRSDPNANLFSYFFMAKPGHMVWLDLNGNARRPHDVAAVISAQRVNALTGQKMNASTGLEQYHFNCPVHGVRFEGDKKFCPKCGFDWPGQNYLATTSVGYGAFWRDGFRADDGKTREFVFTEEESEGVAANLIGDERTEAFGVGLYASRRPKPPAPPVYRGGYHDEMLSFGATKSLGATRGMRSAESLEVGAGAIVNQKVEDDPKRLDFWNPDYAAYFAIYFVGEAGFRRIVGDEIADRGRQPGRQSGGGFLGGVPVGHKNG